MKSGSNKILLASALWAAVFPAWSDERESLEALRRSTSNLIQFLVQDGMLSQDKADALIHDTQPAPAPAAPAGQPQPKADDRTVRVPYLPESVRNGVKEEIRKDVLAQAKSERWGDPGALPDWISRLKWSGDLRVRYQGNFLSSANAPYENVLATNSSGAYTLLNTTQNSGQLRLRARLGLDARLSDWTSASFRITTGSASNPISANQTMGNTFNRYALALDQAYLRLEPWQWLSLSAGRTPNPWVGTDLVWSPDLGFEGVFGRIGSRQQDEGIRPFLTLGAFPLEKQDCTNAVQNAMCRNDKWLYGAQLGFERGWEHQAGFKLGLGYYKYENVAGEMNSLADSANKGMTPKFVQKGNTTFNIDPTGAIRLLGLAADFTELNLTALLDIAVSEPVHLMLAGDYVKNVGYNRDVVLRRTDGQVNVEPRTKGYLARMAAGRQEMRRTGDWQVSAAYKYLERDAVLDAFADSDFHLGGTDARGWVLGGSYGISANTWLTARWLTADQIDGPPLVIDVLQVDLNAKF